MDKRKNYYLVLDVETANSTSEPLVYDLGFAVCDKKGNIYEKRSYIISDVFFDQAAINNNYDLMASSYYAEKLPQYYRGIKTGNWKVTTLFKARKEILQLLKDYNITAVCAYNASFDINALNNTIRYISKSNVRYFFPYGTQVFCIWHMATQVLFNQKTFLKMALDNGWYSESGNVKTSAEMAYRYMTDDIEFEESHTGLKDVEIETAVMARCFRQHKSMNKNINRLCWRIPQKAFKMVSA